MQSFFDSVDKFAPNDHKKLWYQLKDQIYENSGIPCYKTFSQNILCSYECSILEKHCYIDDFAKYVNVKPLCDQSFVIYRWNVCDITKLDILSRLCKYNGYYICKYNCYSDHDEIEYYKKNPCYFLDKFIKTDTITICGVKMPHCNLDVNEFYNNFDYNSYYSKFDEIEKIFVNLSNKYETIYSMIIGNKNNKLEQFIDVVPICRDGNWQIYFCENADYYYVFDWSGS